MTGAWTLCRVPGPRRWRPSKARGDGARRVFASDYGHLSAIRAPSQVRAPKASSRRGKGADSGRRGRGSLDWRGGGRPRREPRRLTRVRSGRGARGSFAARAALGLGVRSRDPAPPPACGGRGLVLHHAYSIRGRVRAVLRHPASPRSRSRWFQRSHAASLPRLSSARSEQLGYFSGRRRGPEPGSAARTSEGGCAFPPVARVPASHSPAAAAGARRPRCWTRGVTPLCVSRLGTLRRAAVPLRAPLGSAVQSPSSPDVPSRSPRLASGAQRSAGLTRLPALSSLLYSFFPPAANTVNSVQFDVLTPTAL